MSDTNLIDMSPPPDGADCVTVMKWMVAVMDVEDASLPFVVSVLGYGLKMGGITERQADGIQKTYGRVLTMFERKALEVQGADYGRDPFAAPNVTQLRPKGSVA